MDFFSDLQNILKDRQRNPVPKSYSSKLFLEGKDRILKKIGEEAGEVIIAAKNNREELIYESGDLFFHLLVLLIHEGISLEEISDELKRRHEKKKRLGMDT